MAATVQDLKNLESYNQLLKDVRILTPEQVLRVREWIHLWKNGRNIIFHASNHESWCPVNNGCCECGKEEA